MTLPFTVDDFLSVFARYNLAIWPVQIAVYAAAAGFVAWVLWRPSRTASLALSALLAFCWVLMGAGYQLGFFRAVSGIALPAGVLFVLTGFGFAWATVRGSLSFAWRRGAWPVLGLILILYAMVGYPILGLATGHHYPRSPVFGVAPCPTTIFTFGVLLLSVSRVPGWLLVVPAAWSLIGVSAAVQLGVWEDLLLPVAGVLGTTGVFLRNRALASAAPAA